MVTVGTCLSCPVCVRGTVADVSRTGMWKTGFGNSWCLLLRVTGGDGLRPSGTSSGRNFKVVVYGTKCKVVVSYMGHETAERPLSDTRGADTTKNLRKSLQEQLS
jgi:hypothetical protein